MSDNRTVDELTLEELEALVEERRRIERARESANDEMDNRFRPLADSSGGPASTPSRRAEKPGYWRDRMLLFVELAAVLGLIAIIVGSLLNLQTLNQEVVQTRGGNPSGANTRTALQELPGSSFPPASQLTELPGSSFPPEPAPVALGVHLQSVAAPPLPTPGPRSPTRIVIPAINIDWPIVPGDGWEELKLGIGYHVGSANPGERGNLILSGHNDIYGEPFRDLEKVEIGKEILVYAGGNAYRYVIKAKRVVAPTDLSVLAPSRNPIITLITCTPYRVDTHRAVLIGELK